MTILAHCLGAGCPRRETCARYWRNTAYTDNQGDDE